MIKADEKFENMVRKTMDQSLDDLDVGTLAEISRLKYRAMDAVEHKKPRKPAWVIAPVLASLLFIVLLNMPQRGDNQFVTPGFTELNILTSAESLDFYDEDIEFYEWCSEVMASEVDMSDQRTSVPADTGTKHTAGAREGRGHVTKLGIDRVSRFIQG